METEGPLPQQGEGHRQAKREMVLQALRAGNTRRASASYAGIEQSTLWRWTSEDADFRSQVEKAEADAEVRHVANIAKAASDGVWTASAWWLERRQHGDWGRKDTLALQLAKKTPEELVDFVAEDLLAAGIDIRALGGSIEEAAAGEAAGGSAPEGAGLLPETGEPELPALPE